MTDKPNTPLATTEAAPDTVASDTIDFHSADGPVAYPMTNDYLFRAVFQTSQKALTGLLCSLLCLDPLEVKSATVTNPIELGKALDDKNFILDITILLNNSMSVSLEMQVINTGNWTERSLSYLCRKFDNLSKGAKYQDVMPVVQVCFLDFNLFPKQMEFYSTYRMLNIKSHHLYSDKFTLSVINLKQIGAATETDKAYQLDQWAAFFKSTEWKEIQMLAQGNDFIQEAAQTMYQLSAEEIIRQQCEARADAERVLQGILEKQERETARADAAEAEARTAKDEAQAAKAEAQTAKNEAQAAKAEAQTAKNEVQTAKARADAAEAEAKIAKDEARAAKTRADAAEARLNTIEEEFKRMREEMEALKRRP